jgi:hypothetical protein
VTLAPDLPLAARLARGVCRAFEQLGYATLVEFPLATGRRVDVLALTRSGEFRCVEIKSSPGDFRTDRKWPLYRDFADRLYFAVAADFPTALIPEDCGLIVADGFGAAVIRDGLATPLAAARRKTLTLRFALIAAARLRRQIDPQSSAADLL